MCASGLCEKVDVIATIFRKTKWSALVPTLADAQTLPGNKNQDSQTNTENHLFQDICSMNIMCNYQAPQYV